MPVARPPLAAREVGPATIALLVVALAALWLVAQPAGAPTGAYVGQLLGAESVLLLSIGLVLISTLPWIEVWFDGIDRAAIWHRRVAIAGVVLLAPHIVIARPPARTGRRWAGRWVPSARSGSSPWRRGRSCRAGGRSFRARCAGCSSPPATHR
jgi:predicted ferric reductase